MTAVKKYGTLSGGPQDGLVFEIDPDDTSGTVVVHTATTTWEKDDVTGEERQIATGEQVTHIYQLDVFGRYAYVRTEGQS